MKPYLFSPKARADLENIWDYTQDSWGITQAENTRMTYGQLLKASRAANNMDVLLITSGQATAKPA